MWNAGKKFRTLRDRKNKYYNTCCPKKNFGTKQKNHNPLPPLQVKRSVPYGFLFRFWCLTVLNAPSERRNPR